MKKLKSYRLSDKSQETLALLVRDDDSNETAVIEQLLREERRRREKRWKNAFPGDTSNVDPITKKEKKK